MENPAVNDASEISAERKSEKDMNRESSMGNSVKHRNPRNGSITMLVPNIFRLMTRSL